MEASRAWAYRLRLLASLAGVFALGVGAPSPWIQTNPAHKGFMTGALYPVATSWHPRGTLLVWGAIVVAGLLVVEVAARATGPVDSLPISRQSARLLGVVALGLALLTLIQFPPLLVERARIVTMAVYLVAIGGDLLIGGSFTHHLQG